MIVHRYQRRLRDTMGCHHNMEVNGCAVSHQLNTTYGIFRTWRGFNTRLDHYKCIATQQIMTTTFISPIGDNSHVLILLCLTRVYPQMTAQMTGTGVAGVPCSLFPVAFKEGNSLQDRVPADRYQKRPPCLNKVDLATIINVLNEPAFARFQFKMSFG